MTVIADITVPAEQFQLERLFAEVPSAEVTMEPVVPLHRTVMPLVWVRSDDQEAVERALRADDEIAEVKRLVETGSESLYELCWRGDLNGVVAAFAEAGVGILEATGTASEWSFRLRFESHEALSQFNMTVTDGGTPVTLRHLYNPTPPTDEPILSAEQRETLLLAYHRDYFEVPRRVTLADLAEETDISDSALSQRIRRGVSTLVERTLLDEDSQ